MFVYAGMYIHVFVFVCMHLKLVCPTPGENCSTVNWNELQREVFKVKQNAYLGAVKKLSSEIRAVRGKQGLENTSSDFHTDHRARLL